MKFFLDKKYAVADHTIINYTGDNVTLKVPEKIDNIVIHSIGEGAFMELPYLQYVRIPSHVTSIGAFAFRSNANLTTVVLPGTIKQIGRLLFQNCKDLSEIKLYDFPMDEKEYRDLKNNSIRAADDVYVSRKIPEIPIIKDMIRACDAVPACIVPDGVNRLFYINYLPTDNGHQLMYRNTYNICFLDKYSKPISEDEGVMECLKNSNKTPGIAKADEVNDGDLRINVHLTPVKTAIFSFHDKETKDIKGKKSLSVTIRIGYFFFQKTRKVICNGKQYYIYQRYYLHYNNNQEFLRIPVHPVTEHERSLWKKALSSGFGSMAVNNQYVASLSCLPVYDENADYGIVCPTACNYMICYKERELALECDEDASGQERSEEEIEKQKALFAGIVRELGHRVLLLPDEKHRKKNVENKYVLMVFTDRFALNTYDTSSSIITTETDLDELYRLVEEDETIMGIVVNPGREDFRMKKY